MIQAIVNLPYHMRPNKTQKRLGITKGSFSMLKVLRIFYTLNSKTWEIPVTKCRGIKSNCQVIYNKIPISRQKYAILIRHRPRIKIISIPVLLATKYSQVKVICAWFLFNVYLKLILYLEYKVIHQMFLQDKYLWQNHRTPKCRSKLYIYMKHT